MNEKRKYLLIITAAVIVIAPFFVFGGARINSPQNNRLADGLIGYWNFEGSSLTTTTSTDVSVNSNDGTLTGGPMPKAGKIGQALEFDGDDDYIDLGNVHDNDGTDPMSWSAWVLKESGDSNWFAKQAAQDSPNQPGWNLFSNASHKFGIQIRSTNPDRILKIADEAMVLGEWYHLAATYDGSKTAAGTNLYINSELVTSFDSTPIDALTGSSANSVSTRISGRDDDTTEWDGKIDEVRIYDRVLSADDILDLYRLGAAEINAAQNNRQTSGLVGYWTFNGPDITTTTSTDVSGNSNDGTLNSGVVPATGKIGQALDIPNSGYVEMSDSPFDIPADQGFTYSAWIKLNSADTGYILNKGISGTFYTLIVRSSPNTRVRVQGNDGTNSFDSSNDGTILNIDEWYHVAFTLDRDTDLMTRYVNGVADGSTSDISSLGAIDNSNDLRFGYHTSATPDAVIDEVRIYERALSADEILKLYRLGTAEVNSPQNNRNASGLIGYWTFNGPDITTTTSTDVSGSGNDGTLNNNPAPKAGKVGQALEFDGSSTYIDTADIDLSTLTISAWINPDSFGSHSNGLGRILDRNNSYTFSLNLDFSGLGTNNLLFYDGDEWEASNNDVISLNTWQHVAVVVDSTTVTFYVNGAESGSDTGTHTITNNNEPATIGRQSNNTALYFDGKIDELRLYSRALSADEILKLYRMGN